MMPSNKTFHHFVVSFQEEEIKTFFILHHGVCSVGILLTTPFTSIKPTNHC
jgi:hypothetical protein